MINGYGGLTVAFLPKAFDGKFLVWNDGEHQLTGPITKNAGYLKGFGVGGRSLEYVLDEAVSFDLIRIANTDTIGGIIDLNAGTVDLLSEIEHGDIYA